ncbi:MAG: OmpH family outer membrane protein [Ignavibacteria bacterium]|nr:OmpH family outer membrane protein [Ignavibacteria bacterium]
MKKIVLLLVAFLVLFTGKNYAQTKIGYVDSDAIMDQLPDAQDARQQLDAVIQEWQSELSKMERDWKSKYDDYDKKKLLLSDQQRSEIEADLMKMEQKITEYREKKFGTNGELFTKQDDLMKPVQNKVFNAVQKVAKAEDFDFVFDRSGGTLMLYSKDKYDITNLVLKELKVVDSGKNPNAKPGTTPKDR